MYISAGIWSLTLSIAFFTFNFFSNLLIARLLGPEPYGLFVFIASLQAFISIFISLPICLPFIRSDGSQQVFDAAWIISLFIGGTSFLIGLIGGGVLGLIYDLQSGVIFLILCCAQLPLVIANLYLARCEKDMNFKMVLTINGSANVIGAAAALITAWCGAGFWSLVSREVIPSLLLWIIVYRFTNVRFSGCWKWSDCTLLIQESIKFLMSRLLEHGFYRVPFILIGFTFGQTHLGLFNQAFYLASLPNTLLSPVTERVAFVGYNRAFGSIEKMSKGLFITNYFIFRLVTPLGFVIYLIGDQLIYFIYGDKWRLAGEIFSMLGLFAALNPAFANIKTACYSLGRQQWVSHSYLLSILTLSITIVYASQFGSMKTLCTGYGIATATGFSYMLIKLSSYGVHLNLRKLLTLPTIYFLTVALILLTNQMPNKPFENIIYMFILVLPYPFLILVLERNEIRSMLEKF